VSYTWFGCEIIQSILLFMFVMIFTASVTFCCILKCRVSRSQDKHNELHLEIYETETGKYFIHIA